MSQSSIDAADKAGANIIMVLGDLIAQPSSVMAIFIACSVAFVYGWLFADCRKPKKERRKVKVSISFIVSFVVFIVLNIDVLSAYTLITGVAVGFMSIMLPLGLLKLLEAYMPKLAHVLEPDEKRSSQLRIATKADLDNPDKKIYTDATKVPTPDEREEIIKGIIDE